MSTPIEIPTTTSPTEPLLEFCDVTRIYGSGEG